MASERYRIGEWDFDADGASLSGKAGERRIEDRAARTLALLCRRRGETVSQAEILAEVWNGRSVSPNSVAVVIADLRRLLGDDASEPRHIVTIPKRGYRLEGQRPSPGRRPAWWAAIALATLLGIGSLAFIQTATPRGGTEQTIIFLLPVENVTGRKSYDPLSKALGELVVNRLGGKPGIEVINGIQPVPAETRVLRLTSRLILWNGEPTLSLSAIEPGTNAIWWTAMAAGPEDAIARNTIFALDRFGDRVRKLPPPSASR